MARAIKAALLTAALALPLPGWAQDSAEMRAQTLADIRQELSLLYVSIQRLRRELSTTGAPQGVTAVGDGPLERIDAIESELQRLTAKTEELEFAIESVVRDGTNKVGDLEFRLCELEPNCDIGSLGDTPSLGGVEVTAPAPAPTPPANGGSQLAVGEEQDFGRASEALAAGDFRAAADQFAAFVETYPGGPLGPRAHLGRGEALENLGEMQEAARAYLSAFSAMPAGPEAPEALYRLGLALGSLGQVSEACVTLTEVGIRFPEAQAAGAARGAMSSLGCS